MQALKIRALHLAGSLHTLGTAAPARRVRRILVLRPDHLGDVLLTTPALRILREGFPDADITLMVGPWSAEVAERQTCIDHVAHARFPGFTRDAQMSLARRYAGLGVLARRLHTEQFDLGIVLRADFWWGAWLLAAARIPLRLGYGLPMVRPFLTHVLPEPSRRHTSVDALDLVASAAVRWGDGRSVTAWRPGTPPLTFSINARDRRVAGTLLEDVGAPRNRFLLIHVGSGTEVKRVPTEQWVQIIEHVRNSFDARIVLTSGSAPAEQATARALHRMTGSVLLSSVPNFGALGAVMQNACVAIGADSGAMHLAVAAGCPSVTLFGPADPMVFGPWGDPALHAVVASDLICAPCDIIDWPAAEVHYHPCMRRLEPNLIARAVARVASAATRRDALK